MSSADPELLSSHLIWFLLLPYWLPCFTWGAMYDVQCVCMCIIHCANLIVPCAMLIVQCAFSKCYDVHELSSMGIRAVRALTPSFKLKDHQQSLPQIKPAQWNQCKESLPPKKLFLGPAPKQRTPPTHSYSLGLPKVKSQKCHEISWTNNMLKEWSNMP